MSEAFLRCPAAALVSGGGDGGVGNVHSEVGPVVEDSAAMKGFDVVAALLAGAGAGDAAGALLQTSFLPEIRKLWGLKNCSFTQNTNCMRESRHISNQERWFCLIRRALAVAVEEHLPLCLHLVVAVAAQLRWLKARLLKMGGGGGEVGNPQPGKHLHHIVMACILP